MAQTIQIVYEPLGSLAGKEFYHESLLYTDSNGDQYIASGGTTADPSGSALFNVSSAASAAANGTASPYGTLSTVTGALSDASVKNSLNLQSLLDLNNPSEVLAVGNDLSEKWAQIVTTEQSIAGENLAYSPITQNSNSLASTALLAADVAPPTDNGIYSSQWAPAADNILPSPTNAGSVDQTSLSLENAQLTKAESEGGSGLNYTGEDGGTTGSGWDGSFGDPSNGGLPIGSDPIAGDPGDGDPGDDPGDDPTTAVVGVGAQTKSVSLNTSTASAVSISNETSSSAAVNKLASVVNNTDGIFVKRNASALSAGSQLIQAMASFSAPSSALIELHPASHSENILIGRPLR